VIGQPDAEWGEVVVACVVRSPGSTVAEPMLDAYCLEHIARFKRPKRYVFIDSLPKNNYGKVLKRELREMLTAPHFANQESVKSRTSRSSGGLILHSESSTQKPSRA
jgi:acyl-CoA synthetase (AMP-forming)/AMP-acid ligase II